MNNAGFSTEEANEALKNGIRGDFWNNEGNRAAESLFSGVEGVLGSYKSSVQSEAYKRLRDSGYGPEDIKIDDEDSAYVTHHHGDWHGKWYGGDYMELFHNSRPDFAADVLHVGAVGHPEKRVKNQSDLESWVNDSGQDTLNWLKDY